MEMARLGAGLTVVWMTAVILSHIFVLGYGWFFVDALIVMEGDPSLCPYRPRSK
jgi:hypothetical protein